MIRLDEKLEEGAENNPSVSELYNNYCSVYNYLEEDYYRFISDNCPWFTDHGKDHIESVINQSSHLLSDHLEKDDLGELEYIDVYILLMSIIWHDVGMVKHRAGHEDITGITEEVKALAFPNPGVRRVVEEIVRAHTGNNALSKARSTQIITVGSQNKEIRPRALAAILRFADEISESQARVSGSSAVLEEVPDDSRIYWEYARSIPGITVKPDRRMVTVSIELEEVKACEKFPCPGDYIHRVDGDEITLMEYIVCRLEKMNNEKAYCAPEFRRYVDIREIEVRISIIGQTNQRVVNKTERLGNAGLRGNNSYPNVNIFDDFFNEHDDLHPEQLGSSDKEVTQQ